MARIGIESGKQCWSHIEIKDLLEAEDFQIEDFQIVDLLSLVQKTQPTMRVDYQKHARKNHSYLWVARLRWLSRIRISQRLGQSETCYPSKPWLSCR